MMYEADPKWQQAKYQFEIGDCEAEFSRYSDPAFLQKHTTYRSFKDFGLDQDWNPQYIKAELEYDIAEDEAKKAKM